MIKIYGKSDDLIEIYGDFNEEINCYGTDEKDKGILLIFSDGTLLEVKYGKMDSAIWGINVVKVGSLFDRILQCTDENAEIYSDIAFIKDGIKWMYAAEEWTSIK